MDPLSIAFGLCGLPFVKEGLEKCLREQVFIHLRSYHKRIQKLEKSVKKLESDKSDVQQIVEEEEDRYGRGILGEVANWIKNADEIICEYGRFIGDERQRLVSKGDYLPNLRARYSLVRKAYDLKRRIDEIFEKKNDSVISYWLGPPSIAPFLANIGYESFSSRDETIKKLNAALENPSVKIIGVYGWSGVGKTTLVKEVAKEALQVKDTEARMFDMVIMASMGNNPAIVKIQGQIADMIGITLVGESEIARAAQIQNKLKNLKRRILIILDDLHEKVDFNMLGIQFENDDIVEETTLEPNVLETQPNDTMKNQNPRGKSKGEVLEEPPNSNNPSSNMVNSKKLFNSSNVTKTKETPRFKVLVISASKQVLSSQMELKEDHIFFVDVLEKKEAEKLFKKIVGADYLKSGFENLASQIASKCGGLPMSIVTTARALKSHQSYSVWETVLSDLQQGKLKRELEFSTKLSYDLLENEELKHTFLLCPFIGHDALVMDLMKYCIGLGILQGKNTIKEARVAVFAMIEKLKQSGLLSESFSIDHFSIQNVARQAAISISSQENVVYSITKIKLDEWPEKLKTCVAIFLHHCDIIEVFSCKITFSWLKIFRLDNNDPCLKIPKNFFKTMKKLKVLILSGIYLSPLPSSIRSLTKLRMFSLENCMLQGKELSIIGELRRLRILSFSGSDIEKLPVELKQLTNLQIFDMSNCYKLREIPTGVISCLTSLEELYMRNSLILSKEEKQAEESLCTVLSELKYLDQLRTLDIQISDIVHLPDNLFLDKLHNYKIVLGDLNVNLETDFKMPEKHETTRFLAINLKDNFDIHSQMGIKMLFDRVENLLLKELKGVEDVFNGLNLKGFPCLKNLMISGNDSIQSLFDPRDTSQAFLKLESLYLNDLKNMSKVCGCVLSKDSFGKLKVIKINQCSQLEVVFSISLVEHLTSLEIIEVSECNSLKKIVYVENESNSNEIKFHELRSLTLESLSDLIGFSSEAEEPTQAITLFGGKVSVSKLERMKLSSLNIQKIWSAESKFEKLTLLEVNGCWKLKYLIPFSMVSSLVNLQSLFISKCDNMESIFKDDKTKVTKDRNIFRKLKNIKLSNMNNLTEIWNSALPETSFGHLETLIIEQCHKIPNVFSHTDYMKGIFRSLCSLTVADCRLMGEIFDLNKYNEKEVELNLQDIHVETLPKLEQIWKWNGEQEKSLKLNKLEKLWVHGCDRLVNVFPFSAARCLDKKLECLVVCDCTRLKEIFAKEIVPKGEANNPTVEFSSLNTIIFSKLPKFESFYPGNFELRALNDVSIQSCNELELFCSTQTKPLVQAINQVKSLEIEPSNYTEEWSWSRRKDKLEELCISGLTTTQILYSFFYSSPHLESLSMNGCFIEEIDPFESLEEEKSLGIVPKLKSLKLANMPNLENLGIEPSLILERVEFMILENCRRLVTMVPSSVSLTHLTNLEVTNCRGLKTLMSPSTAKSLCQLKTMKVGECESLEEIVGNAEKFGDKVDIVFKQLKNLELVSLENLNCFSCSKSCVFKFPSLEKLVVRACRKMKSFAEMEGKQMLRRIDIYADIDVKIMSCRWKDDLNAAIKKMFQEKRYYDGMEKMILRDHSELQPAWRGEVALQTRWFSTLKILTLDGCDYLKPYAIPSNVLPYLKTLKELNVRNCNKVKAIFGMNDGETMGTTTFQLQKLELYLLRDLTRVWEKDNLSFQNLEAVYVDGCDGLESVFPLKVAKNLKKLQKIQIDSCDRLRQIVGMEGVAEANRTEEFVFPRLTLMDLFELPKLSRFYSGDFTLECPSLNQLSVLGCPIFESAQLQGSGVMKAISNVEELSLEGNLISVVDQPDTEFRYLHKIGMRFDKSNNPTQPIQILKKAANLQEMRIHDCSNRDIFEFGGVGVQHLEELTLEEVSKLKGIGLDGLKWLKPLCGKIHKLNIRWCRDLTLLFVESPSAFSNLKQLYVYVCDRLEYLLTSSMANSLKQLEEINVDWCDAVEYIIKVENATSEEGVTFNSLHTIHLNRLPKLECFSSGGLELQLPSLSQVEIQECPSMEIFSQGSIKAKKFRQVRLQNYGKPPVYFKNEDLNSTIQMLFLHQKFQKGMDDETFSKYHLQQLWVGNDSEQSNWFEGLKIMKLVNCKVKGYAIPSNILSCLKSLQELEMRGCNQVTFIFGMKGTESVKIASPLRKLWLVRLSVLTHVWEDNCQAISTTFQNLEQVYVENCKSLQSVFPAAIGKNLKKLKKLEIKYCDELKEIVGTVQHQIAEETAQVFEIPALTSLYLRELPKLTCFYPEAFTLLCLRLNTLFVLQCPKLEILSTAQPGSDGSSTSINRQSLFSDLEAIPKLEEVRLDWKHTWLLQKLVKDLQCLRDICIHFHGYVSENVVYWSGITITNDMEELRLKKVADLKLQWVWTDNVLCSNKVFQKLHKLKVEGCENLKYLLTSSIAKELKQLVELTVKDCESITEIVAKGEEETTSEAHIITFERLEHIKLRFLPMVECFYGGNATVQLPSLKRVEIEECPKMDNFCPYLEEQPFQAAPNLPTYDSDGELVLHNDLNISLRRAFFQQKFENGMDNETFSKHHLQQVWVDKVSEQSYLFEGLKIMKLVNCEVQGYAIPSNILSCLKSLQELEMRGCNQVTFIFGMKGTESVKIASPLRKLWLVGLSVLTHVWEDNCQAITTTFQNLERVHVENCKSLQGVFPAAIGKNLKKLKKLEIKYCDELKEIVGTVQHQIAEETAQVFEIPALTSLYLRELPKLTCFYPEAFTLMCLRLNTLFVLQCPKLEILSIAQPGSDGSSTSINRQSLFSDLEAIPKLEEVRLDWKHTWLLQKLVKDLQRLDEIRFHFHGNVIENVEYWSGITITNDMEELRLKKVCDLKLQWVWTDNVLCSNKVFQKLHKLKVVGCENLKYLLTSSIAKELKQLVELTVEDCESITEIVAKGEEETTSEVHTITFKRLKHIKLKNLSKLECFYGGNATVQLPSLEGVETEECPKMDNFCPQLETRHVDFNMSVLVQDFEKGMDIETFSKHHLQQLWVHKVSKQSNFFEALKSMKLVNCEFEGYAIPSNILPCLKSLQELKIEDCNQVNFIFDMKTESVKIAFLLRKLWLKRLPVLTHVWEDNCQAITTTFQNLEQVHVEKCKSLQMVFPAAMAKNLKKLEKLEIKYCDELKEIVGKVQHQIAEETAQVFEIPALTTLYLQELPKLTCFYPEAFTLICLRLNTLFVLECPKLEILSIAQPGSDGSSTSINRQSLVSDLEAIPKLKEVRLDWKHIWLLQKLVKDLECLHDIAIQFDGDVSEEIEDWSGITITDHMEELRLTEVSDLKLQWVWTDNVLCSNKVFQKLHKLKVEGCENLKYLLTSSIAKELKQLVELTVEDCESITEIVAKGEEETTSEAHIITFKRLKYIELKKLSMVECFYGGNATVQLPSLKGVEIEECPKMDNFCPHLEAQFSRYNGELVLHNDLNISVRRAFFRQDHIVVGNSVLMRRIWLNSEAIEEWYFCNLTCLVVEGCDFLSNEVLPSHLLHLLLRNLKELQVRKCKSVKAIFGSNNPLSSFGIKKLILEDLPMLEEIVSTFASEQPNEEHVILFPKVTTLKLWNLPTLKEIYSGTHTLEWPSLRELDVYHCQMLKCFATEYQNSTKDQDMQLIVSLKKVTPNLKALRISKEEGMMIEQGKLHVDLQKLKTLKLHHFGDESLDVFPFVFHSKVSLPCFQSLEFHESAFKQIFPSRGCNQNILSQLKELHLHKLSQLQSIGLEHSWMAPFPKKLETLSVSECHGLKYLFTSSTAKMLASLEEITVTNCESLQEIVLADEGELEEIMFNELGVLILMSLPKLGSFYKGTSTLKLPSLSRVSFTHCHNTKLFPHRDSLPRLSYVKIDGEYYYGDDMHYLLEVVAA